MKGSHRCHKELKSYKNGTLRKKRPEYSLYFDEKC